MDDLNALRAQLHESFEQQNAVREVLEAMSQSPSDLQPVVQTIADRAARLCEAVDVLVVGRDGDWLPTLAHVGPIPTVDRHPLTMAMFTGRAVLTGQTVHVIDAQLDENAHARAIAIKDGYHTVLATPLLRAGGPIGALYIRRTMVKPFTASQIELLETFAAQTVIAIENVRFFNETKEALQRQTATAEVLRAISGSPTDVQPVLDAIAANAVRYCGAEDALVFLLSAGVLDPKAHAGPVIGGPAPEGLPLDRDSVTGHAFLDRRTVQVADQQDDAAHPLGQQIAARTGHRTVLGTPLLRQGEPVGAIVLRRTIVQPFTPEQVQLVEAFASQAVIAIENVRLFNETKEALERQTAISEILRSISASPTDVRPVLDAIVLSALRFCAAEDAGIMLPAGDYLQLAAHRGTVPVADDLRYPNDGTSVSSRAFLESRTVSVDDLQIANEFPMGAAHARANGYHAIVAAPLRRDGSAIGTIVLRRFDAKPFSDSEIAALETFADQAAIAIGNVNLFNEIRQKSAQLEVVNSELAEASRHKSEFLANMSHELRTPLNAIIGFSDVLEQQMFGELNDQQSDYVRDISGSGRHLLNLVNEILDLAKVEAGRMELEPTEFVLDETIRGAIAFVRERAAQHRIELTTDVAPDTGTLLADERKVRQVLLNLLSNAVKFTPDGGRVGVSCRRDGGEIEVSVRDTGIGIAPEDLPKVFEEFQQVGGPSERAHEGTGLGLTLAKGFIELHGGRIWVDSEVGHGSTFTFRIPAMTVVAS